jgi:hypothetical protein
MMERGLEFGERKLMFEVGNKESISYEYNGRALLYRLVVTGSSQ